MLVLSRKVGERIIIEPGIEIAVVDMRGGRVRLGIAAPSHVGIRRMEVAPRDHRLGNHQPSDGWQLATADSGQALE